MVISSPNTPPPLIDAAARIVFLKLSEAAAAFNESCYALVSWFPNLLNRAWEWFFEQSAEFICRTVDPSLWNTRPFTHFDCERRLHPWWFWFKQIIFEYRMIEVSLFLFLVLFVIGVATAVYLLDETLAIVTGKQIGRAHV